MPERLSKSTTTGPTRIYTKATKLKEAAKFRKMNEAGRRQRSDQAGSMNASIPLINHLEPFWMPYTANRQFKSNPRLPVSAWDMHYGVADGRRILDATAGLWCCNAGHARPRIVEAVQTSALRR